MRKSSRPERCSTTSVSPPTPIRRGGTAVRRADVLHGLHGVYHEHRAGDPSWELERVAAAITAPLIAVGSRGLGPWEDALLGTVARRLLQTARRPILVLPAASVLDQEMA